jgi:23S rRNA (adenine2503-C2)-methyltransferase
MNSVLEHTPDELREAFARNGLEPFRADQVLRWVYGRGVRDFGAMSDLARTLREQLAGAWRIRCLERDSLCESSDGTRKLVLRAWDGAKIELVMIPEERRRTLCVSSQVGCSLDCSFCATGRLGLGRNLRAEELVDQVLHGAELLAPSSEKITHVVFMGMGEPLLNLRNVIHAIRILADPRAGALSPRRITVSTAGVVPSIAELGRALRVRLAVSLHATTDAVRDILVPLNRRFPIASLLEACRRYPASRRDPISFEYALIRDVNDSRDDARRLARLLRGLRAKVNLIRMNEHPGTHYRRPSEATVEAFAETLAASQVTVTLRRSRGEDIFAACGQLGALAQTGRGVSSPAFVR